MASDVDICNMALSHLGDTASVSSIDPPEGSAQAGHCATFYPIARDALLELHNWNFITRRATLTLLDAEINPWAYVYSVPSSLKKIISVVPPDADDDYTSPNVTLYDWYDDPGYGFIVPQPYARETLSTGTPVICTNQKSAVLRYTVTITDPALFSSLFTITLSYSLASLLAGPIIKGEPGRLEAKRCIEMMNGFLATARISDAEQHKANITHQVPWLAGR